MFELLSNIQSVPVDQDSLAMVHRGMNKVRVSVGDYISEPSEVYILTGQSNGNLESYIVFYLLGPGINLVYGCGQNPYPPELKEKVIDEAIIFVEELGSILEEIPWESMTPDQRSSWIENEILFAEPVVEELEEIEEIQAVEIIQIDEGATGETETEDGAVVDFTEDVIEVSDEELEQESLEDGPGETLPAPEEVNEKSKDVSVQLEEGDDEADDDETGLEDVVVAEGDFDELLKQAFLNPDVAEKTKLKKSKRKGIKVEKKQPVPASPISEETTGGKVEEGMGLSGADGSVDVEEELKIPWEPESGKTEVEKVESYSSDEELVDDTGESFSLTNGGVTAEKDTRLKVVRFLSRF